jgi:hypothetical protein
MGHPPYFVVVVTVRVVRPWTQRAGFTSSGFTSWMPLATGAPSCVSATMALPEVYIGSSSAPE